MTLNDSNIQEGTGKDMKRSKLWSASITMIAMIVMFSAFGVIGPVFGHDTEKSKSAGEERTDSNEGGRSTRHEGAGEHSGGEGDDENAGDPDCEIDDAAERARALDESYAATLFGLRLTLSYDAANNQFVGTVENTTDAMLAQLRVHIHLSNGADLGPTTPTDLAAGGVINIAMDATDQPFDSWTPHVAVDSDEYSDPSSPDLALDESWDGVVNGLRTSMSYDEARGAFAGFVENPGDQVLRFVQIELNLKQDGVTMVELGPYPVGDLAPGARMAVELLVADEPLAADVTFDAWEIHPEVAICDEPGTVDIKDADEGEDGIGDETERFGKYALALDEVYDVTHNGARLVMRYDETSNRFVGTVENTTNAMLTRVRVEIHLSNGVELGPTTPTDLAAGAVMNIAMDATDQPFDSWPPHAEVGRGEGGGEHGGREGRGEHGGG